MENENVRFDSLDSIKISFSNLKNAIAWCKRQKQLSKLKDDLHYVSSDSDITVDVREHGNQAFAIVNYWGC